MRYTSACRVPRHATLARASEPIQHHHHAQQRAHADPSTRLDASYPLLQRGQNSFDDFVA